MNFINFDRAGAALAAAGINLAKCKIQIEGTVGFHITDLNNNLLAAVCPPELFSLARRAYGPARIVTIEDDKGEVVLHVHIPQAPAPDLTN